MGRKRTRSGKFLYFFAASLIFSLLTNCASLQQYYSPKREVYTEKITTLEKLPKPSPAGLERAARLLRQGDYDGSLKENQRVLVLCGQKPPGDKALFNMALISAHRENPKKDYTQTLLLLRQIVRDYPQSALLDEVKIWVGVLEENEKLKGVIEKSNEVDLTVDEKRRVKTR
jgi:hypothetical protein